GRTELRETHAEKWKLCEITNSEQRTGGIAEALVGADVCIALSTPGPDTLKKEWIEKMNKDAIVFACANPIPEIWPWEAKEAGARIVSTGRSDFPNQVNNSLCFPSIFRGVLDVQGRTITDTMCIAAAQALADFAAEKGLHEEKILPTMDEWEVFPRVAVATALQAIKEGVARITLSEDELYALANQAIKRAQDTTKFLMEKEIIPKAPF
ncbi:MAG: malate dehydrogenase, partial [Firmicutes bacterium]|nr:malate dehydrogenase [Bacillota bacterium]